MKGALRDDMAIAKKLNEFIELDFTADNMVWEIPTPHKFFLADRSKERNHIEITK